MSIYSRVLALLLIITWPLILVFITSPEKPSGEVEIDPDGICVEVSRKPRILECTPREYITCFIFPGNVSECVSDN